MTGKEIRVWMAENEMRNRELGERLGRDEETISKWRNAGVPTQMGPAIRLALWAIAEQRRQAKAPRK